MERFGSFYDFPYGDSPDKKLKIAPKGIDGAKELVAADAETLLGQHLRIERNDVKSFWKDGFILFKLWITGAYCDMYPADRGVPYPYKKEAFYEFLHDRGSHISPDECSRRMYVFRAYNKYDTTVIRLVERAGISKAHIAIPHIRDETVRDMLQLCIDTPAYILRRTLQAIYPRLEKGKLRARRSPATAQADLERRALRAISNNHTGMIGVPAVFVPRQYRQEGEDELRAKEVFEFAMNRLGFNDRDLFFMRVVDLVSKSWLTEEDRQAIDQRIAVVRAGDAARRAMAAD